MTGSEIPLSQTNEVPFRVSTTRGQAVITLVAVTHNVELRGDGTGHDAAVRRDRIVLRAALTGYPNVYVVFERVGGTVSWQRATNDLTLAELGDWTAHRCSTGSPLDPAFEAWLQRMFPPR